MVKFRTIKGKDIYLCLEENRKCLTISACDSKGNYLSDRCFILCLNKENKKSSRCWGVDTSIGISLDEGKVISVSRSVRG